MTLDDTGLRPDPTAAPRRRAAGDPVKALLHRHRELCERAVDPLEIAAGLEAHGITDRTATRFRHRDVFSLAEELYARTPRGDGRAVPAPAGATGPAALRGEELYARTPRGDGRAVPAPAGATGPAALRGFGYALLPGAVALGASAARVPWAGAVAVAVTVAALVWPGRTAGGRFPGLSHLLAAAAVGWAVHRGGPALGVALALAVAPAHLAAGAFAARARRGLAGSRALQDFAAGVRPLLVVTVAAFTAAAAGAAGLAGAPLAAAVPLAALLFLTRLVLAHGAHRVAAAAALAVALAPVPSAPLAAAAGLLVHAVVALSRASAHARH